MAVRSPLSVGTMREDGLILATNAAGGVSALTQRSGNTQPIVSSRHLVPVEHVVATSTFTELDRGLLRPDLFADQGQVLTAMTASDEIGALRAQEYLLLAALLRFPVTRDLLDKLATISGDPSPLGLAHLQLADAASAVGEREAGREFFNLFIGVGRGELLPYASFYLTGFLNERPLGRVREDLAKLGIQRADGNFDPEDHVATLLETMAGLANGEIAAEPDFEKAFFERHLKPWVARFFADLAVAPSSHFYKAVAGVGLAFIAIETEAFTLPYTPEQAH